MFVWQLHELICQHYILTGTLFFEKPYNMLFKIEGRIIELKVFKNTNNVIQYEFPSFKKF